MAELDSGVKVEGVSVRKVPVCGFCRVDGPVIVERPTVSRVVGSYFMGIVSFCGSCGGVFGVSHMPISEGLARKLLGEPGSNLVLPQGVRFDLKKGDK